MLVLTEAAARVVKSVTATLEEAGTAGLRIASVAPGPEGHDALQVTTAPVPEENDQVIEVCAARIYLEPQAAALLEDMILDAQPGTRGNTRVLPGRAG